VRPMSRSARLARGGALAQGIVLAAFLGAWALAFFVSRGSGPC
jgi:hypothetical protein